MKNPARLYLTGASGAGVTTLGAALAARLGVAHLDVDDFFWLPTDPPFVEKRPPEDRVRLIRDRQAGAGWVLSGSFDLWGEALCAEAESIVFISAPGPVRLTRLADRETQRFGARILPGGDMHEGHLAFRAWAAGYDDPAFGGRSRVRHEAWLARQTLPVLRLDGTRPVPELAEAVLRARGRTP